MLSFSYKSCVGFLPFWRKLNVLDCSDNNFPAALS